MKKTLVIVAIIIISLGFGVAGTVYFLRHKPHIGIKKLSMSRQAEKTLPTQNFELEERTVNLADAPPDTHYLRVTIVLEVSGKGKAEELKKERMPQLMDRMIDVISQEHYALLIHRAGKEHLKRNLAQVFSDELAKTGWTVHRVLFTDFVME